MTTNATETLLEAFAAGRFKVRTEIAEGIDFSATFIPASRGTLTSIRDSLVFVSAEGDAMTEETMAALVKVKGAVVIAPGIARFPLKKTVFDRVARIVGAVKLVKK